MIFQLKKFFHFDFDETVNNKIFECFATIMGFNCIESLKSKTDNCLCKVFLYIILFFQFINILALCCPLSIEIKFQTISRKLYYDDIYEFIDLIEYNWLFYLNVIRFEILNVITFFQILVIHIICLIN